ncbi:hypothetical protein [Dysgonomonas sp.]
MKKLLPIFLLLTLSFAFSACGGSDDKDELRADPSFNPILGSWRGSGMKINEKYVFTSDFRCQKYERESQTSPWQLSTENNYLINSTHIKIGNNESITYFIRNRIELYIPINKNEVTEYVYYKE